MNEQSKDTTRRRDIAEERLNSAIMRLEFLIDSQNEKANNEKQLRVQIIKDLDEHISKLGNIVEG